MACHPWRPPFGSSLCDVNNGSRPLFLRKQGAKNAGATLDFSISRRCARLGGGIEEAAEGDVAGAFFGGGFGQFQLGVAGAADNCFAPEQGAGDGQRAIALPQRSEEHTSELQS